MTGNYDPIDVVKALLDPAAVFRTSRGDSLRVMTLPFNRRSKSCAAGNMTHIRWKLRKRRIWAAEGTQIF